MGRHARSKIYTPRVKELYKKLFPAYTDRIKEELVGAHLNFILDLECRKSSPIKSSSRNFYTVGIDIFGQYLLESKKRKTHNEYILGGVRKLCFQPKSFDAVLGIDLLEHISKSRDRKLIKVREKIAKRKVVIFTTMVSFLNMSIMEMYFRFIDLDGLLMNLNNLDIT